MVVLNEVYEATIESVNIFGNGVCHIDSFVVFVKDALAFEKCKIIITKVFKSYAYANVIERISASKSRCIPCCNVYNECGGCSFLHMDLEAENLSKLDFVRSVFAKNKIEASFEEISCMANQEYRNKVVLFYGKDGFGYNEQKSTKVIEHEKCILNDADFDRIAKFTKEYLKNTPIRALYMRKGKGVMVCPIFYTPVDIISYATALINEFPMVETVLNASLKDKDFAMEKIKFKTVYGCGYIEDDLCGLTFKISPKSFYQVNKKGAEALYSKAIELLDAKENEIIGDLFCGTGTMGIIVAKKTKARVYGVEIEPDAVRDAKINAKSNGVSNIEFFAMDAGKLDKKLDACIIDPPRKGCTDLMISTLLRLKPSRIVYVSCNPNTMCRDLKLLESDYKISSKVHTYNLFPRTSHVESLVCLTRK